MSEAALLPLSNHSALLSIREDWTPFNIRQYTPSFTVSKIWLVQHAVWAKEAVMPLFCLSLVPVSKLWGHCRLRQYFLCISVFVQFRHVCGDMFFLPEAGGICALTYRTKIPSIFISTPVAPWSMSPADSLYQLQPYAHVSQALLSYANLLEFPRFCPYFLWPLIYLSFSFMFVRSWTQLNMINRGSAFDFLLALLNNTPPKICQIFFWCMSHKRCVYIP